MITEQLAHWCSQHQLTVTDEQLASFEKYAELLIEWNQKMNLTAITEKKEIAVKHFIDSLSLLTVIDLPKGASLIDIGTGAGFPGIPLKIMRPDLHVTLLDSLNKRLLFLQAVCQALHLDCTLQHARAEEFGQKPEFREQFDYATSRAVANLPALCEYCLPYVKVGGSFLPMKGPDGPSELETAKNAIHQLGGGDQPAVFSLILPDDSTRTIIQITKTRPTPTRYPRRGVKINKQPL